MHEDKCDLNYSLYTNGNNNNMENTKEREIKIKQEFKNREGLEIQIEENLLIIHILLENFYMIDYINTKFSKSYLYFA